MAGPTHQFVIQKIVPLEVGGVDLSFTNSALWMCLAAAISILFFTLSTKRKALVPGRAQALSEMFYEFVAGMIRENIGQQGRQYFPLVFTVFVVVLMGNLLGLLPFSFTYTSHIVVTGVLALGIFLLVTLIGIVRHGLCFFSLFCPPGVPFVLKFLVVPIEVLSFVIRPVTLSVRLFANMMAGHLMLKVFAGFSVMMVTSMGATGFAMALFPAAFNAAFLAFEVLIALVQAYVFALLTCVYLKDSVEIHH